MSWSHRILGEKTLSQPAACDVCRCGMDVVVRVLSKSTWQQHPPYCFRDPNGGYFKVASSFMPNRQ